MSYLQEFEKQIINRDFDKLLELWEEYCNSESADVPELIAVLKKIKASDFAPSFGSYVEMAIPLWQTIEDQKNNYQVLKHLIDLQTTNTPVLAEIATQVIKASYPSDPKQSERLRMVGLRNRDSFQGALSQYDLLAHMAPGKFVYHSGGWGAGEIMEVSAVREQIGVEFETLSGVKQFTFINAIKVLEPLPDNHFLAKRFGNPDAFETEAKEDPVKVIKQLLTDLGPKSASEIKDEMCGLIIPEDDWNRWWQNARAKLKKDPFIDNPKALKDCFVLRENEQTQDELLENTFLNKQEPDAIILSCYNLLRDTSKSKKNQQVFETTKEKLIELEQKDYISLGQRLQTLLLLDQFLDYKPGNTSAEALIKSLKDPIAVLNSIDIVALKKKTLTLFQREREDWQSLYLDLLETVTAAPLREYLFDELFEKGEQSKLSGRLDEIRKAPKRSPELVIWYLGKLLNAKYKEDIPYGDKEGLWLWFDCFLVLLNAIENDPTQKDVVKKMMHIITNKHYFNLRFIFEGTTEEWIEEFLLLLSKCMVFEDSDRKIFNSLAQVVHPNAGVVETKQKPARQDHHIFWSTDQSYQNARQEANRIATVDIIENAREVEAARALGDLRENAEYKAATERRRRLQHELRTLGSQIDSARIITEQDVNTNEIGIGNIVTLSNGSKEAQTYTLLGPWDANIDKMILSHQSLLAQTMMGKQVGDTFTFRDEEYTVVKIKSFFE
jgi:transcription elongation factor GreA-like protein/transcription elongation GreA/GreB family factor